MPIPQEATIEADASGVALEQAQAIADNMFLVERAAIRLEVFDEGGNVIGRVVGPSPNCPRPCEGITLPDGTIGNCPDHARYRESYRDGASERCGYHLMPPEWRREWFASGSLIGIYDLLEKKHLHPVTLEPIDPNRN
ncbi:hypothetical protein C4552_01260 [Candidatus Parcubacteria bacterium]|nr:MAG: hypothetical protein C4552_01260 [Candidatus Parcubacteria bacterium]